MHETLGQPSAALSDAQQCLKLAPDSSKGHLRAGRALIGLGRIDEALEVLERAVARDTQDYGLRQALQDAQDQIALTRSLALALNFSLALVIPGPDGYLRADMMILSKDGVLRILWNPWG